ncbi:hypothetical protein BKA70DRAFT_120352 [Coprinopsis sp. MPI-PUGE-AT-0042]|nr:hypothetical protein BKA70DRAFT_120352 [Coprinopsis sp. MPI-PUGE-AT-0042]
MSTPFDYHPPTTSGRPVTSTGRRPGTANPFRQLVEQQQASGSGTNPVVLPTLKPSTLVGADDIPRPTTSYTLDPNRNPYSSQGGDVPHRMYYGRPDSDGLEDDISEEGGRFGAYHYSEESHGTGGFGYTEDSHDQRPYTSGGLHQQQPPQQQQQPQHHQGQPPPMTAGASEYDDEEESDVEDVFAFLPPTTAEVEEERRRAEEEAQTRRLEVPQASFNPYGQQQQQQSYSYGDGQQQYSYGQQSQDYSYGAPAAAGGRDENSAVAAHLALLGRGGAPSLFGPGASAEPTFPYPQASSSAAPPPPAIHVDDPATSKKIRQQDPSFAYGLRDDEYDEDIVPSPTSYQSGHSKRSQQQHRKGGPRSLEPGYGEGWQESPTSATGFFDPSLARSPSKTAGQPPKYEYGPPVSPPSTESNSNDGSRAGRGDGFKMTRLDRRRSSRLGDDDGFVQDEGEGNRSVARKSGEQQQQRRKSGLTLDDGARDNESITIAASIEGKEAVGSPTSLTGAMKEHLEVPLQLSGKEKEKEKATGKSKSRSRERSDKEERNTPVYGAHWQHFQPNPARHNPNSGPYRRHREYHYNQAYPQYATGVSGSGGFGAGGEAGPSDPMRAYGDGALTAGIGVSLGGAGMSRRRRRRKHQVGTPEARVGTGDTDRTTRTSEYAGGSEYGEETRRRRRDPEDGYGSRPDTGLTSLGYRKEGMEGDRRGGESDVDEMYDDEYADEYGDDESREGSIK